MENQGKADRKSPGSETVPEIREELRAERRRELLERAKEAPLDPGIYVMRSGDGDVLYVGKAKNLRNRVSSYFQSTPHAIPRTELMVSRVDHFDMVITATEAEALILEWTLIKKHKPRFNIRLKDDKSYPYLKIRSDEPFPRIEWTRKVLKDDAQYFGPFPSAFSARTVLRLLNETFRLRDCSDNTFRHRSRPCLLFQMEKCSAPCVGKVTPADYAELLSHAREVLEGKGDKVVGDLKVQMNEAAVHEEFELAAFYRDQIQALDLVTRTQVAAEAGSARSRDVVGLARVDTLAHGTILRVRGGRLTAAKHFTLTNSDPSVSDAELLSQFLAQHYVAMEQKQDGAGEVGSRNAEFADGVAADVLVPVVPSDLELLTQALRLNIVEASTPQESQLLNVARSNAEYALEQERKRSLGHGLQALEEIQDKLGLPRLPIRIECYDISNIQGDDSVASRVVFVDGAPDKNLYRRYKIKTVEGQNDFAMMREVLGRRFLSATEPLPDLVVVDGGKGQLAQAVAIFEELGVQGVEVVGLAKARTERDFQAKEVSSSLERIFIPGRKNPVNLYPTSLAYRLLTHIRDEAHRFAVSYHRKVRSKRTLEGRGD